MEQKTIAIQGMTCHHCVMAVKKQLSKIEGLVVKDVQIGFALVEYNAGEVAPGRIRSAIEEAGYTALN